MVEPNPFTPTFGVTPPLLVGRDDLLEEFGIAIDEGVGSPYRAVVITGVRGSGKTVALNALEDVARRRGWAVASATARKGVSSDLATEIIPQAIRDHGGHAADSSVTAMQLMVLGIGGQVQRQVSERFPVKPGLRTVCTAAADLMDERSGSGLLITLDEIHRSAMDDIVEIAQTVQHMFREGRPVAFVAAGLPSAVESVLNNDVITFLRRAERFTLGAVSDDDVAEALRRPIHDHGKAIAGGALAEAVKATGGYPFLIQLVGSETWRASGDGASVTLDAAREGGRRAARRVGRLVHEPSLADLSHTDRSFLSAMAVDEGPSQMGDIAARLGVSAQYAGVYRQQCIMQGIVAPAGRGLVDFTIPYLRDYLKEHAASTALADWPTE